MAAEGPAHPTGRSAARAPPVVDHARPDGRSTTARSRAASRPVRSPTSRSCRSSRSSRSRSSSSARSRRSSRRADENLVEAINDGAAGHHRRGEGQPDLARGHRGRRDHGRTARSARSALRRPRLALRDARRAAASCSSSRAEEHPNFVVGKLRDLVALVMLGVVLVLSVAVAGFVTGVLRRRSSTGWIWTPSSSWLVTADRPRDRLRRQHGALLRLLQAARAIRTTPNRSLWSGALLGAVGVRGAQAALVPAAGLDQGQPGVPGVRHRADPAGLDQLHLARS